jgi:hypothetical protein
VPQPTYASASLQYPFVGVMVLKNATRKHCYCISFPVDGDSCTEPLDVWHLIRTYGISVLTYCLGKPGYKIDEDKLGERDVILGKVHIDLE